MEKAKPWQIILMVLAVIALGFSVWKFGFSGGRVVQPDSFMTVDIMTGQLYELRKGKARGMLLPAKNPDSGGRTLYPVEELDGVWVVKNAYLGYLSEDDLKKSKVTGGSGVVQVMDTDPIVHVIRK